MGIQLSSGFNIQAPELIDARSGPWSTTSAACSAIPTGQYVIGLLAWINSPVGLYAMTSTSPCTFTLLATGSGSPYNLFQTLTAGNDAGNLSEVNLFNIAIGTSSNSITFDAGGGPEQYYPMLFNVNQFTVPSSPHSRHIYALP